MNEEFKTELTRRLRMTFEKEEQLERDVFTLDEVMQAIDIALTLKGE